MPVRSNAAMQQFAAMRQRVSAHSRSEPAAGEQADDACGAGRADSPRRPCPRRKPAPSDLRAHSGGSARRAARAARGTSAKRRLSPQRRRRRSWRRTDSLGATISSAKSARSSQRGRAFISGDAGCTSAAPVFSSSRLSGKTSILEDFQSSTWHFRLEPRRLGPSSSTPRRR